MDVLNNKAAGRVIYLIGLGIILLATVFSYTAPYQWVENKLLDLRFKFRKPIPISDQVTHIDIDDGSIETIGRWPWSRDKHYRLLELLKSLKAKSVVFDIDFYEPGQISIEQGKLDKEFQQVFANPPGPNDSPDNQQAYINKLRERVGAIIDNYDQHLAMASKFSKNVYLTCQFPRDLTNPPAALPESFLSGRINYPDTNRLADQDNKNLQLPLESFAGYARGMGFVDIVPDSDGVLRCISLVKEYQDGLYPQLAFRVACEALGITPEMIAIFPGERIELRRPNQPAINIPIDAEGRVLINWVGNRDINWEHTFNRLPYDHLILKIARTQSLLDSGNSVEVSPEDRQELETVASLINGKICLVGMTASGNVDLKPTPSSPLLPGVNAHSNLINMILTNNFIHQSPGWLNFLIIFGCGILITLVAGKLNPLLSVAATISLIIIFTFIAFRIFSDYGIWFDLTGPLFTGFFGFAAIKTYRTITEEKAKKQVQHIFGHYLSPRVVSELLKNPDKLKLGGDKKVMTVFFSDIANFTNMSSGLSPEVIMGWINRYLTAMTDIIQEYEGMIDKYEGDAIMALFGAPVSRPDHAKLACWSALKQLHKLNDLNRHFQADGLPQIKIRAGINSGEMVVGNLGSSKVLSYTVMGEEVILASRLEGINKYYQTNIIASESTYQMARDEVEARELDFILAKGMKRPVRIYEIIAPKGQADSAAQELIAQYTLALEAYRAHEWDEAIDLLNLCRKIKPDDGPTVRLLGQCYQFKQLPPGAEINTTNVLTAK